MPSVSKGVYDKLQSEYDDLKKANVELKERNSDLKKRIKDVEDMINVAIEGALIKRNRPVRGQR